MDEFEPKRATADDAMRVRSLSRRAYAKWAELIGREPLPMTADYTSAVRNHLIDLWEDGGQLIALVEMIDRADHLLIENIAVDPARQGRGCGGVLLAHAERVAQNLGHSEVRLFTNAAFASNIGFYAKRGYAETKREVLVRGHVAVHMAKRLPVRL
ncbi:MAG: GNAT family N-acetyltransferase [Alphaproteobacteria bacterium]|nr:GNAT family N-acetyltransferase [Alphaproteobacteria bacterium]MCB9929523.1 GNAT family N-acetyltransferase [Alphaproteobacteria bacterium]